MERGHSRIAGLDLTSCSASGRHCISCSICASRPPQPPLSTFMGSIPRRPSSIRGTSSSSSSSPAARRGETLRAGWGFPRCVATKRTEERRRLRVERAFAVLYGTVGVGGRQPEAREEDQHSGRQHGGPRRGSLCSRWPDQGRGFLRFANNCPAGPLVLRHALRLSVLSCSAGPSPLAGSHRSVSLSLLGAGQASHGGTEPFGVRKAWRWGIRGSIIINCKQWVSCCLTIIWSKWPLNGHLNRLNSHLNGNDVALCRV